MRAKTIHLVLTVAVSLPMLVAGGCHRVAEPFENDLGADASVDAGVDDMAAASDFGGPPPDLQPGELDIEPVAPQTITVHVGSPPPVLAYTATLEGAPVNVAWNIDRGDIASLPVVTGSAVTFTPRGSVGGVVTLTANFNGQTVQRKVSVNLVAAQNGASSSNPSEARQIANSVADLTSGGGVGGVGGEGLGVAVTDANTIAVLDAPSPDGGTADALKLLYPYDGTVWPRGMLAPLVMWQWSVGDADAIKMTLSTTSGSYSWSGTFGRPAILAQTNGAFIRMPIPQDVWQAATQTAGLPLPSGGVDKLTFSLVVAKNGVGYGPISQTWVIASAPLSGIIYYQSYGTQLAKNLNGAKGGDGTFGGAILSIHVGDTAPQLAAGKTSTDSQSSGCRVCHSVAANGSRLITQQGNSYGTTSDYDIATTGLTEHVLAHNATFAGLSPDGTKALAYDGTLLPLPMDTTPITTTGITSFSMQLGSPTFSPDGKHVAFDPQEAANGGGQKLFIMDYDDATATFSNPTAVVDDTVLATQGIYAGWPSFMPDSKSIVFDQQVQSGVDGTNGGQFCTRKFAKSQIAWTSTTDAMHTTTLNQLNGLDASGKSYLPQLSTPSTLSCLADDYQVGGGPPGPNTFSNPTPDLSHQDDIHLNYEPTVNPIGTGGYAWVVFTSRRLYGNEATIPPYCSDPRGVDLVKNITTKKLWVAAIDLNAPPGSDASHPAFYLPAQELLAGNSRAFWVLDPCRADGSSCDSGDECCNGYCEADGDGGLVCEHTLPTGSCSKVGDKCQSAADCCDPASDACVNGFCALAQPPIQ